MEKTLTPVKIHAALHMSDAEFDQISRFMFQRTGIKLPYVKKVLVEGRLQKVVRGLGMESFAEYLQTAIGKQADPSQTVLLIDTLTTNKTDFFRESAHFDYLKNALIRQAEAGRSGQNIKIWSAACSTGEEPYTIAMVLHELKLAGIISDFEIIATDISTHVLRKAISAEYAAARIHPIPDHMKRKYLLKHKDQSLNQFKISKNLRDHISFDSLNLMDESWPKLGRFDAIFCRNVFIYFERETQFKVTKTMIPHLKADGMLFLGHSESLNGLNLPLYAAGNAIYKISREVVKPARTPENV